jgi:hypothetical protein
MCWYSARAPELKLNAALKPAGRLLGRTVHANAWTTQSLKNQFRSSESFVLGVVQGPRIALIGDLDAATLPAPGQ